MSGPGLWPEGTATTTYAVDLGGQTLVAEVVTPPAGDHARDAAVLDALVEGLDIGVVPA